MRLQNQVGGATAGAHAFNSSHIADGTSSSLTAPATDDRSNGEEPTMDADTAVDVFSQTSSDSHDDQQLFPIEVDGNSLHSPTPTAVDERHPPKFSATSAAALIHSGELQEQRTRHTSSCSLELLPPLMSYEESHTKSPSLHGSGSHLTDEEQV